MRDATPLISSRSDRLLAVVVPVMMLIAPFLGMLRSLNHSVWRTDSLACLAILSAIGVLCGALVSRDGRTRVLGLAVLLTVTVDLMLKGLSYSEVLFQLWPVSTISVEPIAAAALFLIALLPCWALRQNLLQILGAGFAVTLVSTVLLPASTGRPREVASWQAPENSRASESSTAPLILHLILDEHIGLEGLAADIPGSQDLRQTLVSFYEEFGFRVYDRSYSVYIDTTDSVPNLLNFSTLDGKDALVAQSGSAQSSRFSLLRNAYFERLKRRGYRIHVYESEYLDFCGSGSSRVDECHVYPLWGFGVSADAIPLAGRIRLLFSLHVKDSVVNHTAKNTLYKRLQRLFPRLVPWTWERGTGPLTTMSALERLRRDLTRASEGDAYFAHLLLPHSPYVYDSACRIRHPRDWRLPVNPSVAGIAQNTPASRRESYILYFEQTYCLYSQIRALLEQLRGSGRLDGAIVLIHGDHGSRIVERNDEDWKLEDYLDMYSTLYALRVPGLEPGLDHSRRSLTQLFNEFWTGRTDVPHEPFVFVGGPRRFERRRLSDIGWDPVPPRH